MDEGFSQEHNLPQLFFKLIPLHENRDLQWEELLGEVPHLPRGWFELSRLSREDRIEFTRDFWLSKLSFSQAPALDDQLISFFSQVDNIEIFLTQETKYSPFDVHMVYSLQEKNSYFHGFPPAHKEEIQHLCKQFESATFPKNYLAFFEIHDGFSKYMDRGLIRIKEMAKANFKFQQLLSSELLIGAEGFSINPTSLIPFYESSELHAYQCFFTEWGPLEEMGNICYSADLDQGLPFFLPHFLENGGASPTFLHWLIHYLKEEESLPLY